MHIDTHCHIDLFNNALEIARAYEGSQVCCVMTTMLASHYEKSLPYVEPYKKILPALGLHPLRVKEGIKEINLFNKYIQNVEFIGEIGLDLSTEGKNTFNLQLAMLKKILPEIREGKFVSVHSRGAHKEIAELLKEFGVGPICFHYFIGGPYEAEKLVAEGHYFSINHRMINGKHKNLIEVIPQEQILVESDGPFLTKRPLVKIMYVYHELSKIWQEDEKFVEKQVESNFNNCRTKFLKYC